MAKRRGRQFAHGRGIAQAYGSSARATVNIGMTPEQVQELALALSRQESASQDKVEELSRRLAVTEQAVAGFFHILGERDVPMERLPEALVEIVQRHKRCLERLALLNREGVEERKGFREAQSAVERGDYDRADEILRQAESAELTALQGAEELARDARKAADRRRFAAAATRAERGELSMIRRDYLQAAQHFRAASDFLPDHWVPLRGDYLTRHADALLREGEERGDDVALVEAIAAYGHALRHFPRERAPNGWATTQSNLGSALCVLGERKGDTVRLEQGVKAFRAALQERSREKTPLDWAATQSNLANALCALGKRESGTDRLQEAVDAYWAALAVFMPGQVSLAHTSFANMLRALVEPGSDTAEMTEAEAAFLVMVAALEALTPERDALACAKIQVNLADALCALGERERSGVLLLLAGQLCHLALKMCDRENSPLDAASTDNVFGTVLLKLIHLEPAHVEYAELAEKAFRAALEVFTREQHPVDWGMAQHNLGVALYELGRRADGKEILGEAAEAFRAALQVCTRERDPLGWATIQDSLGSVLRELNENDGALACYRAALEERTRERVPVSWARTQFNLGLALHSLGAAGSDGVGLLQQAVAAYRAALQEISPEGRGNVEKALDRAQALLAARGPETPVAATVRGDG